MANGRRGHGEGSIFQRKTDGRWIGQADLGWSEGKRKRRFVTGTSRKDVQERLANLVREHQLGLLPKGGKVTTGAFLQSWLDEIATPRVRPSTLQRYRELTAHWSDLNRIPLEKVSASDVQRVLNAKSKQMAARTVHHMRSVLRTALNAAIRRQLITRNAASLADPPRVVRAELAVLTEGQASALLTAIKGGQLESPVKIALSLGLRRGEALGLRWCDVDLEVGILRVSHALQRINKKQLLVEPKSSTSRRTILLPAVALEALRGHRKAQVAERIRLGELWLGASWDLVFCNGYGLPLEGTNVTRSFQAIVKTAGLPRMRFHDLRHSCATLLLVQGVPARAVMELLGHSDIHLTLGTYSHVVPALQRQTADAMDRALGG
jgi:integrase